MPEAKRKKKNKWLWIQLLLVGLLTAKLLLVGFDFGRSWLDNLFKPAVAVAQQADQKDQQEPADEGKKSGNGDAKTDEAGAKPGSDQSGQAKPGPQQLELLRSLEARQKRLETQERELDRRSKELTALEQLVDQKMATLEKLRTEFEAQVKAEEARQNNRIKHLVALYSNMKPKAAAEVVEKMDLDLAVEIFRQMRGREAGKVLAYVSPEKASKISQMLSEKVEN